MTTTTTTTLIPGRIGEGNERLLLQSMRLFFLKKSCCRSSLHYTHCIKEKTLRRAHRHTQRHTNKRNPGLFMSSLKKLPTFSSHNKLFIRKPKPPPKIKTAHSQSVSQSVTNRFHKQAAAATAAPSLYGFLHHLLLPGSFSLSLPLFSSLSNCVLYKQTLKASFSQQ